jgi:hypothetical protein
VYSDVDDRLEWNYVRRAVCANGGHQSDVHIAGELERASVQLTILCCVGVNNVARIQMRCCIRYAGALSYIINGSTRPVVSFARKKVDITFMQCYFNILTALAVDSSLHVPLCVPAL